MKCNEGFKAVPTIQSDTGEFISEYIKQMINVSYDKLSDMMDGFQTFQTHLYV